MFFVFEEAVNSTAFTMRNTSLSTLIIYNFLNIAKGIV